MQITQPSPRTYSFTILHTLFPPHTHPYVDTHSKRGLVCDCVGYKSYKHTARLAWRHVFWAIHTEWGSLLSYSPRFAHTLLALFLALQKSSVCMYLKMLLGLTAIQTHTYTPLPPHPPTHHTHTHTHTHPPPPPHTAHHTPHIQHTHPTYTASTPHISLTHEWNTTREKRAYFWHAAH